MKMTETFRRLFLKLIYNNKKKERGWRRYLVISDVLPYAVAAGAVVVALIAIYMMRNEKKNNLLLRFIDVTSFYDGDQNANAWEC